MGSPAEGGPLAIPADRSGGLAIEADAGSACCGLYGDPRLIALLGDSLHPGGLALTRALLAGAGLAPTAQLLDLGSGSGTSAALAAEAFGLRVDGIDAEASSVARAQAGVTSPSVRFVAGRIEALPFPDGRYDAALAECVLSTVTDRAAALGEIHRVLRARGLLLLSDVVAEPGIGASLGLPQVVSRALCLGGAWVPGEASLQLDRAGFTIRWERDERAALEAFIDRIEARLALSQTIRHDLGRALGAMAGALGVDALSSQPWPRILDRLRAAVVGGRLGYVSLIADRG